MKQNSLMKKRAYRACLIASLCLSLGAVTACSNEAAPDETAPSLITPMGVTINTIKVERRNIVNSTYTTSVVFPRKIDLCFDIDGEVGEVFVERGQYIEKGTLIAKLDEEKLMEKLEELTKTREKMQEAHDKQKKAYDERVASINKEIRDLKSRINSASGTEKNRLKANREIKQIDLERLTLEITNWEASEEKKFADFDEDYNEVKEKIGQNCLYAPEAGYVTSDLLGLIGKQVKAEKNAVTMLDDTVLYINGTYMSEKNFDLLAEHYVLINGEKVELTYVPLTDEELKRVTATATPGAAVDRTVKYQVSPKAGQTVKAGDYAIKVFTTDVLENVIALPHGVIQKDQLGSYVYVVKDQSRIRVEVIPGKSDQSFVEIISGLSEGDEVYVQY